MRSASLSGIAERYAAVVLRGFEKNRLQCRKRVASSYRPKTPSQVQANKEFAHALASGVLETVEVVCPVCGHDSFEDVANVERQGFPLRTVLCGRCPTMYSKTVLTDEGLNLFYSNFYRHLYGGRQIPDDDWFDSQFRNGQRILAEYSSFSERSNWPDGLKVLEIGTGAGGALLPFHQQGANVIGIDLDEEYLSFGRGKGLNLVRGSIADLPNLPRQNLIILKDVLEHLPRPLEALKLARGSLTPNGVCYIQVPSFQSLKYLGYRNDLLRYLQFAHVVHFTRESLTYLCQCAGLEVVYSDQRAIVMCRPADSQIPAKTPPPREVAVDALNRIYRTRLLTSWDYRVRSAIPEPIKKLLRTTRSVSQRLTSR